MHHRNDAIATTLARHQVGVGTSVFKAGSTVPAKIQLKRDDGQTYWASLGLR
jgi:hypothetical protein